MKTRLTGLVVSAILLLPVAIASDRLALDVSCIPDKTTGECAPGVCEQCCNAFIKDEKKCASCLQNECPPPAPGHNCMPNTGTNKCDDPEVCPACCSPYVDQCDACVDEKCPKPIPSWLPGKRWCFAVDPHMSTTSGGETLPCSGCGLVFNTVESTPGGPAVAHGTLNYTGYAWGTYGTKFECIKMAYEYDNQTHTLSFPNVATPGSVANKCLAVFVPDPPIVHRGHQCNNGQPGPKLANIADWSFHGLSEGQFTCIRDDLKFPDDRTKGCVRAHWDIVMKFSDAISQCRMSSLAGTIAWRFYRKTNGAASECRFPFPK